MRPRLAVFLPLLLGGCELVFGIHETSSSSDASSSASTGAGNASGTGGAGGTAGSTTSQPGSGGGGGSGGAAPHFCDANPGHYFCADFDESSDVAHGWDPTNHDGNAVSVARSTTIRHSKPAAFAAARVAAPQGCEAGRLIKDLPKETTAVDVDFWMQPCDKDLTSETARLQMVDLNCTPEDEDGGVGSVFGIMNFGMRKGGAGVELWGATGTTHSESTYKGFELPPQGKFTHVHIRLDMDIQGSARVTYDGVEKMNRAANTACPGNQVRSLAIGMFTCTELPPCTIYFDDILIDVEPKP